MKEDAKKQLDRIQRQERVRKILPAIFASLTLIILIAVVLIYRYSPGYAVEVSGVVTGLYGKPVPKRGEIIYFMVQLDDGRVVKAKKPNEVLYRKNQRVQLLETKTYMFGNIRYDFKTYVEGVENSHLAK